jgi:chemotaxis protein histidine kinase CheA
METQPQAFPDGKDHEVIDPPVKLGHLVIKGSGNGFDFDAIARAEKALESLSENFNAWMDEEIEHLVAARATAASMDYSPDSVDTLFHAAHDIKGQAKTLGHPVAADVAAGLCRLISGFDEPTRLPRILVDQHVDAIRAIVREHASEVNTEIAETLARRLSLVTEEVLEKERERREEAQAAAASSQ